MIRFIDRKTQYAALKADIDRMHPDLDAALQARIVRALAACVNAAPRAAAPAATEVEAAAAL